MTDICPDQNQLLKKSSKRKCQQSLMANIFLSTSTDIYLKYPNDLLFFLFLPSLFLSSPAPSKCSSPKAFLTVCVDGHLSDDISVLSTGMIMPVGSSTYSYYSLLCFLFLPLLLAASTVWRNYQSDAIRSFQGRDIHPYRIQHKVFEMFKKSSKIFGEPHMSLWFHDSCMQLP